MKTLNSVGGGKLGQTIFGGCRLRGCVMAHGTATIIILRHHRFVSPER